MAGAVLVCSRPGLSVLLRQVVSCRVGEPIFVDVLVVSRALPWFLPCWLYQSLLNKLHLLKIEVSVPLSLVWARTVECRAVELLTHG